MNNNKKRIILVGKGGSGKDHLRKILEKGGFKYCVSHTTRPIRENEIDGRDYFFIQPEDLGDTSTLSKIFYEWTKFNDWFYGTSFLEFVTSDLFIMTPSGIAKLREDDRKESVIIFVDIDEQTRRKRLESRADADKADRRIKADEDDFLGFKDYDYSITNPKFTAKDIENLLKVVYK